MNKYILVFMLSAIGVNLFAQPSNLNFEVWSSGEPVNWVTFNSIAPGSVTEETTFEGEGTASAKLMVVPCSLCPLGGLPNPFAGFVAQDQPYIYRPATLSFKWRGNIETGDTALIGSELTDNGLLVGSATFYINGATTNGVWTTETINYTYNLTNDPDSVNIGALSDISIFDGGTSSSMTYLWVDNFILSGGTIGFETLEATNKNILAFPNPASTSVNIDSRGTNANRFELFSVDGKLMLTQNQLPEKYVLNVQHLNEGSYFMRFYRDNTLIGTTRFEVLR